VEQLTHNERITSEAPTHLAMRYEEIAARLARLEDQAAPLSPHPQSVQFAAHLSAMSQRARLTRHMPRLPAALARAGACGFQLDVWIPGSSTVRDRLDEPARVHQITATAST
jgi:hypothetical protein